MQPRCTIDALSVLCGAMPGCPHSLIERGLALLAPAPLLPPTGLLDVCSARCEANHECPAVALVALAVWMTVCSKRTNPISPLPQRPCSRFSPRGNRGQREAPRVPAPRVEIRLARGEAVRKPKRGDVGF